MVLDLSSGVTCWSVSVLQVAEAQSDMLGVRRSDLSGFPYYCSDCLNVQQLPVSCTQGDIKLLCSLRSFDSMFRKRLFLFLSFKKKKKKSVDKSMIPLNLKAQIFVLDVKKLQQSQKQAWARPPSAESTLVICDLKCFWSTFCLRFWFPLKGQRSVSWHKDTFCMSDNILTC